MNSLGRTPEITRSALLPSVCQDHVATRVLLVVGTNPTSNLNTHAGTNYLKHAAALGRPTQAVQANPPSCAPPETLTLASRCRRRNLDSATSASSRSTSRAAQGGEAPAGIACCRFRAPCRLGAVAGVRRRTEPRHRVERRRRCDLAVRAY
jgi:hypothetical protein